MLCEYAREKFVYLQSDEEDTQSVAEAAYFLEWLLAYISNCADS